MHTAPQAFAPIFALAEEAPVSSPSGDPAAHEGHPAPRPAQTQDVPKASDHTSRADPEAVPPGKLRVRVPKVFIVQATQPIRLGQQLS